MWPLQIILTQNLTWKTTASGSLILSYIILIISFQLLITYCKANYSFYRKLSIKSLRGNFKRLQGLTKSIYTRIYNTDFGAVSQTDFTRWQLSFVYVAGYPLTQNLNES